MPAGLSQAHAEADPAPGLQQAAPRVPVFAVALALPKPCCCPVGTGAVGFGASQRVMFPLPAHKCA